ncbi:MAG: hypothetical protein NVSMB27_14270 [Ktedonobacteraceae bacterium]
MDAQGTITINILCYGMQSEDLQILLSEYISDPEETPQFHVESEKSRFRTLDPSVLVAIAGVSGTALGSLLSGLLRIAQEKKSQKIVIQSKDGSKLEVPSDTPPERIEELVKKLRMMEAPHIYL